MIVAAFLAGSAAAVFYAWLLWQNVRSMAASRKAPLIAAGGFTLRIAVCGTVFVLAAYGGHFDRLIACAAGFMIARAAAVNMLKQRKERA